MTKNFKKIITFLIIFLIITLIILINSISSIKNSIPRKILTLQNSFDLSSPIFYLTKENYPDNPYDVISLYLEGYKLIYDDFISNQDVISIILEQQRLLLDDSILNKNSLSSQKNALFESINYLLEAGFKLNSINIEDTQINDDENEVIFNVIKTDNNNQVYNFKYYLNLNHEGYWKITYWQNDNLQFLIQNK